MKKIDFNKNFISRIQVSPNTFESERNVPAFLGLVFYKYLSDMYTINAAEFISGKLPDTLIEAEAICKKNNTFKVNKEVKKRLRYYLHPWMTYRNMMDAVKFRRFKADTLYRVFFHIQKSHPVFDGIFELAIESLEKIRLEDADKNRVVGILLEGIDLCQFSTNNADDNAQLFNELLEVLSINSRFKFGAIHCPDLINELFLKIAFNDHQNEDSLKICQPCASGAQMMINAHHFLRPDVKINYFGQEISAVHYDVSRMNFIINGIDDSTYKLEKLRKVPLTKKNFRLHKADKFLPADNYDVMMMNLNYALDLPPKVETFRFDYYDDDTGITLHNMVLSGYNEIVRSFSALKETGTMACLHNYRILSRGLYEKENRKQLLDRGMIYAIIVLPSGVLYDQIVPTCILVFKKNHEKKDILFIDATELCEKSTKHKQMNKEHIDEVFDLYCNRQTVDRKAYLASYDEIMSKDYDLDIRKYVIQPKRKIPISFTSLGLYQR